MWEGGRDRSWGNEGGNERESRDGESKRQYSQPGEVKERGTEREKKGEEWKMKIGKQHWTSSI